MARLSYPTLIVLVIARGGTCLRLPGETVHEKVDLNHLYDMRLQDLHLHPSDNSPKRFGELWAQEENDVTTLQEGMKAPSRTEKEREDQRNSCVHITGGERPPQADKSWGASLYTEQPSVPDAHVKNVICIPSIGAEKELRKAHRETWMQQKGVCTIDQHADPDCHTFPFFFLSAGIAPDEREIVLQDCEDRSHVDRSQLPMSGSQRFDFVDQNCKIYNLFKHAKEHFPWATHVTKMDIDTFPHIQRIHDDLSRAPQNATFYGHYGAFSNCEEPSLQGAFFTLTSDLLDFMVVDLKFLASFNGFADAEIANTLWGGQKKHSIPRLTCVNPSLGSGRWQHPV